MWSIEFEEFAQSDPACFASEFFLELRTLMPQTFAYMTSIGRFQSRFGTEVNMDGISGWTRLGEDLQRQTNEERKDGAEIKSGCQSCKAAGNSSSKTEKQDGVDPNHKAHCNSVTTNETGIFSPKKLEDYLQTKILNANDPIECSYGPQRTQKRRKS